MGSGKQACHSPTTFGVQNPERVPNLPRWARASKLATRPRHLEFRTLRGFRTSRDGLGQASLPLAHALVQRRALNRRRALGSDMLARRMGFRGAPWVLATILWAPWLRAAPCEEPAHTRLWWSPES